MASKEYSEPIANNEVNEALIDSGLLTFDIKYNVVKKVVQKLRKRFVVSNGLTYEDLLQEGTLIALTTELDSTFKRGQQVNFLERSIYWNLYNRFFSKYFNTSRKDFKQRYLSTFICPERISVTDGRKFISDVDKRLEAERIWKIAAKTCIDTDIEYCKEFFCKGFTQREIAEMHNVTHQRVQQIVTRFVNNIRDYLLREHEINTVVNTGFIGYESLTDEQLALFRKGRKKE